MWYVFVWIRVPTDAFVGFRPENVPLPPICHHSLPPDNEFEFQYSRNEDDQVAENALRTGDGTISAEVGTYELL